MADRGGGVPGGPPNCAEGVLVPPLPPLNGAVATLRLDTGLGTSRHLAPPKHHVIVAIGDSYGSGQGNPDLPARWRGGLRLRDGSVGGWMTRRTNLARRGEARWLDEACSRSFFSFQSLTALGGLASRDPHAFVSFLHHACSGGAEIFDGVLSPPQKTPPGNTKTYNRLSQVNAVIRELCLAPPTTDYAPPIADPARGGEEPLSFRRRNGSC